MSQGELSTCGRCYLGRCNCKQEIADLRKRLGWSKERENTATATIADLRAQSESWRHAHSQWQSWARGLLDEYGRQPLHGVHGDEPARELIATLVGLAPGVPRCVRCGCFATRHEVDDEELRGCSDCECGQFEGSGVCIARAALKGTR